MAPHCASYVGIDICADAVCEARRRARQIGMHPIAEWHVGDAAHVVRQWGRHTWRREPFDVISCQMGLHYWNVDDAARILVDVPVRRGAALVLTLPDAGTILDSRHVVRVHPGGRRYVYHWPPFVCHSEEHRIDLNELETRLHGWRLIWNVRFDQLTDQRHYGVPDDRFYRAAVLVMA